MLVPVGGLPRAHGDASQVAALRHTLAWGAVDTALAQVKQRYRQQNAALHSRPAN